MGPQGERYQEEERQRSREAATWTHRVCQASVTIKLMLAPGRGALPSTATFPNATLDLDAVREQIFACRTKISCPPASARAAVETLRCATDDGPGAKPLCTLPRALGRCSWRRGLLQDYLLWCSRMTIARTSPTRCRLSRPSCLPPPRAARDLLDTAFLPSHATSNTPRKRPARALCDAGRVLTC